jgi:hypothetical protein
LETCRDAQEAQALLSRFTVYSTGPQVHLLVADANGDSFIAEFPEANRGAAIFLPKGKDQDYHFMTNFHEDTGGWNGNLGYKEGPCIRYETLASMMQKHETVFRGPEEVKDVLFQVRMSDTSEDMRQGMETSMNTVIMTVYDLDERKARFYFPDDGFSSAVTLGF